MFKMKVFQNQLARCLITRSCNSFSSSAKSIFQTSALFNQKKQVSTQPSQIITLIPGDGIGPEMMQHVQTVIKELGVSLDFEIMSLSKKNNTDAALRSCIESVRRNRVAIKGNLETEHKLLDSGSQSRNVELRTQLDLYASVLHVRSLYGIPSPLDNTPDGKPGPKIDVVLIRENTEGEYSGLEHESVPGVIESLKIVTRAKTARVARFAFEYARNRHRKHVTVVHKANIQKLGDGLFLETCTQVGKGYAVHGIACDSQIIDNCTMQLVRRPQQFDVMLMPNLYGNIVANILSGLVGGAGVVSGQNIGESCAIFESGTRSSGANIAGQNIANPASYLFAAADMLNYIGYYSHADHLVGALKRVLADPANHTADIRSKRSSPPARTSDFMRALIAQLEQRAGP